MGASVRGLIVDNNGNCYVGDLPDHPVLPAAELAGRDDDIIEDEPELTDDEVELLYKPWMFNEAIAELMENMAGCRVVGQLEFDEIEIVLTDGFSDFEVVGMWTDDKKIFIDIRDVELIEDTDPDDIDDDLDPIENEVVYE